MARATGDDVPRGRAALAPLVAVCRREPGSGR